MTTVPATTPTTLRARLLRRLWWPLLVVLLVSASYDYMSALDRARDNQDLSLNRIAIALTSRMDVDADDARDDDLGQHLGRTMAAMQRTDAQDQLSFMVRNASGQLIGGDARLATLADATGRSAPVYADHEIDGRAVRVVTLPHASSLGQVTVVVAETTQRRQAQARRLFIDTLVPNLLLIGLSLALVRRGVKVAMSPLDALSQGIAKRAPGDLGALPLAGLPAELLNVVQAINRLMERVKTSAQAQQAFLSNAAHQLRTPLAGVQTQLELAMRESTLHERDRLQRVQYALRRMAHTTHQMLALARSDSQAATVEEFAPVDLQSLLEEAASAWLDPALGAGVDLGFDAQPAEVIGSAWLLQEMLSNLIDNAIRHSPHSGRVTVCCGSDGAHCWLSVEDEGAGIAADERSRVLGRFYQGPGAAQGGTGLGLAIVSEVAQRHGAELTLEPGENAKGLRVTVRFVARL
jgi:two-component system sensor histidine kinase TctE